VVLTLIGLVSGSVWSAWVFSERSLQQWREQIKLETEHHTLLNGISEDLYRAELIRIVDNQHIHLDVSDTLSHVFTVINKKLLLNDKTLTDREFQVSEFSIIANDNPSFLILESSGQMSSGSPELITIHLEITNSRDTLQSQRSVFIRKPSAWAPLNRQ